MLCSARYVGRIIIMNIKRGLIRLWLFLTVLFVLAVGIFSFRPIRDEFRRAHQESSGPNFPQDVIADPKFQALSPAAQRIVLSKLDPNFAGMPEEAQEAAVQQVNQSATGPWLHYRSQQIPPLPKGSTLLFPVGCEQARGKTPADYFVESGSCWYTPAKFRDFYPEYRRVSDDVLFARLYLHPGAPLDELLRFNSANTEAYYAALAKQFGGSTLLPVECSQARGQTHDYRVERGYCWYEMQKFRALYPEYADIDELELTRRIYEKAHLQPVQVAHPWSMLGSRASIAFGVPLAVLGIGFCLTWVIEGFLRSVENNT